MQIDDNTKTIICKQNGILLIEDIIALWDEVINTKEFRNKGYNIIYDYRDAEFGFEIDQTTELDTYLKKVKNITKGKKSAIIINSPEAIVIPTLYKKKSENELNFEMKIFTTYRAAQHFVMT